MLKAFLRASLKHKRWKGRAEKFIRSHRISKVNSATVKFDFCAIECKELLRKCRNVG
jgi:hypothetical protein